MKEPPELPDDDEPPLESLEPLAENLAGGGAIDWDAANSSELTTSRKAVLRQLRAIAQIASAHERFAREADVLLDAAPAAAGERRTWGQLILRSYIGRGSFGDVYRAWDPRLDREVALKLVTPTDTGETARSSTIISEGRALARVRHPNVVTVYGADEIGGRVGVWMEFVEGRTLTQRIASDGPIAPPETAAIGADLARALAAVHKAGLLHRDVKAQNVMCEAGGRIVLTDFGTAVPHEEREAATDGDVVDVTPPVDTPPDSIASRRVTFAGTPLYLAPEVLDGAAQTPRSDIYALGVLLFHALTGIFPVTGRTLREVHERHREGQRTSLSASRPNLPPALVSIVDRALASDPAVRFQTADEMAIALDEVTRRRVRRTKWVAVAAVAVATLAGAAWLAGLVPLARTGTVPAKEPDLVLIASFENATGNARLGQTVERAVAEAVTASRAFAVATPDRVNKVRGHMRRAPGSALDAASAREAARRDGGIRAVITGSVAGSGDRPAIEVRIVAPVSGANVATIKEASAGGEVGRVLDALRVGVTGVLDAQQEALPPPIAEYEHVTTASVEALRTYTEARAGFERRDFRGAADLFQRATTLDPDFALAYTWLGWIRFNAGSPYVGEFAKGDELARKLSPEERLWARGSHLVGLHDERAFADFWDLLQLDPLHTWALHNLAAHVRDDPHESERLIYYWERQAAANPNDVKSLYETARALLFSTHPERAWPYVDRVLKLAKDRPDGAVSVYRAFALTAPAKDAWGRSRVSETVERMGPVCDAVTGRPRDMEQIQAFCNSLRVALGQLQRADPYANEWEKADIADFRDDRETLRRLYESTEVNPVLRVWIASRLGIIDDGGDQAERPLGRFKLRHYADLARGSSETLQLFAGWQMVPTAVLGLAEVYADALVRVGDSARAIEVLRSATSDRRTAMGWGATWIRARNAYAELLRRLGRDAEAEPVERDLLSMLSEADADHVIAAKLRARYGGSPPRAKR